MITGNLKKISKFLNDLSIKYKLLLSYFLLIVIPLGILTWLIYARSAEMIEQKMLSLTDKSLEQTSESLTAKLEDAITVSNMIFDSQDIQKNISMDINNYSMSQQIDDASRMTLYLKNLEYGHNISKIRLYVRDQIIYSHEHINWFSMQDIANEEWYPKVVNDGNKVHWIYGNQQYSDRDDKPYTISAIRTLSNYKSWGETVGFVCIDIEGTKIQEILEDNNVTKEGIIYLADENGTIISSSDNALMSGKYKDINHYFNLEQKELEWEKIDFYGHTMLAGYKTIKCTGWNLVAAIPIEDILTPSIKLRNYSFPAMIVIGGIAYLLALYVAFPIIKRIDGLIRSTRRAEQGDLNVKIYSDGKDEIGELERSFNNMLESITSLIEEKYKMGRDVKNAELKALQAQINPHFLYNTLDLINWRAKKYQALDIQFLVNALAKFYKLSLSNGRDIISIGDEIAHVEVYVQIQNKRFKDGIQLHINIDPGILDYSILKLILQPIVENSILHGIRNKAEKTGNIDISAFSEEDMIVLKVRDDGIGMDEEKLSRILNSESPRDGHGYGIRNVNERIKLYYGEKYGLTYKSEVGEGTEVEVRIPAIK